MGVKRLVSVRKSNDKNKRERSKQTDVDFCNLSQNLWKAEGILFWAIFPWDEGGSSQNFLSIILTIFETLGLKVNKVLNQNSLKVGVIYSKHHKVSIFYE